MTLRDLVDNRDNGTMEEALKTAIEGSIEKLKETPSLDIATGYFNIGGFALVANQLEKLEKVRLLLGAEPPAEGKVIPVALGGPRGVQAEKKQLEVQLALQDEGLRQDRDLIDFSEENESVVQRLIRFQRDGQLEVKRFKGIFLHAKAFILSHGEGVFVGSSNFTYSGLRKNLELNVSRKDDTPYKQACDWYSKLWGEAEDYDLAKLYEDRFASHRPWLVYMRALFERYGHELDEESGGLSRIELTTFQSDGVERARRILARYNGVLVADSVGLGKSFIAARLIEDARKLRQRVLLVAPAALRDGPWARFMARTDIRVEVKSFEQVSAGSLEMPASYYSMIVVDEAHGVRNPDADRSKALRVLLAGDPPKKLVLLTATPVNNSVWDLFYLLEYFIRQDATFAEAGVRSMRELFKHAYRTNPDDLTPDLLFELLDRVVVRRTRSFIKKYYPNDRIKLPDGSELIIEFPKPHIKKLGYNLNESVPGFFEEFERLVMPEDSNPILTLARYTPSVYKIAGDIEQQEVTVVGLVRSGMLKRFESSIHAFEITVRRMIVHHRTFLDMLGKGKVPSSAAIDAVLELPTGDNDELNSALEDLEHDGDLEDATGYKVSELRAAVESDLKILERMHEQVEPITASQSPKLKALVTALEDIAEQADKDGKNPEQRRDNRKVLVFTYFADTMNWIYDFLETEIESNPKLAHFRSRMAKVSGSDGTGDAFNFAPISMDAPEDKRDDKFDILITTDVLAEGVNLQQCRNLINFDLPWNPMRLVQRHGRIDRIGSPHKHNYISCFLPDDELDRLLRLHDRIQDKVKVAARTVGVESEILPGAETSDVNLGVTDEIRRIEDGDASLLENGGEREGPESGEEFRQELRRALQNHEKEITEFPWGGGSAIPTAGPSGFFFCARVGKESLYRFVSSDRSLIDARVLSSLRRIRCAESTEDILTEDLRTEAYSAWDSAREDILLKWNELTDPANLQPKIPPSMQKAADIIRSHPDKDWSSQFISELVGRLQSPHGFKVLRRIQKEMKAHEEDPKACAKQLAVVVKELGLQPYEPPKPLEFIESEDVNLICWMALVNQGNAKSAVE